MRRPEPRASLGRLDGIEWLVAAVEAGSFAAAARRLGVTPSAVSRRVAQLEQELGVELLARTTRSLRLTDDGRAFHDRCVRVLEEIDEARSVLAHASKKPSGLLRIDAPIALGRELIAPALPRFLARYPEIEVALTLHDRQVDPVAEGVDVLIRIGALGDSSLVARRLGTSQVLLVASPAYLRKHGRPRRPADLAHHRGLGFLREGRPRPFTFAASDGSVQRVPVRGRAHANDADVLRQLALAGQGIAALFDFLARASLADGSLVHVLADHPGPVWPIHALYPRNRHLVPRVSVFLAFAAELFGAGDTRRGRTVR